MVIADIARAVMLALLATAVATAKLSIALLVAVAFLVGIAGCFFDPASQAAIPMMEGRQQTALTPADGRLWSLDPIGRSLIGPPVGRFCS